MLMLVSPLEREDFAQPARVTVPPAREAIVATRPSMRGRSGAQAQRAAPSRSLIPPSSQATSSGVSLMFSALRLSSSSSSVRGPINGTDGKGCAKHISQRHMDRALAKPVRQFDRAVAALEVTVRVPDPH